MGADVKVSSGVSIGRRVATADVTASQAETKVYPRAADSQTVLAAVGARTHFADGRHMWIEHICILIVAFKANSALDYLQP